MEDETQLHRNWLLYLTIGLAAAVAILGVAGTIIWLDRQQAIEDRAKLALAAAVDQWARYDASLAACERGNTLRMQISDYAEGFDALNDLLVQFFDSSVRFRKESGQPALAKEAIATRERIRAVAKAVKPVPLIDCSVTVIIPSAPRPNGSPYAK